MSTLYEYYNINDDDAFYDLNYHIGQTFTPLLAHTITSVKLKLYRTGIPLLITVNVRATDGDGMPTGPVLCSGTSDGSTLTTDTGGEWREISLGSGYALAANTKYAIILPKRGDVDNRIWWRRDRTDPTYTRGNPVYSADNITWDADLEKEYMFEEWGDPIVALPRSRGFIIG